MIFVLAGWMVRGENGEWRTDTISDQLEPVSGLGGRLRVLAAFQLASEHAEYRIVLSGGKGQFARMADAPTVSEVMKQELIHLGIPEARITLLEKGRNTVGELVRLEAFARRRKFEEIVVISNQYHLPRIIALIEHLHELKSLLRLRSDGRLRLESAEDLLQRHDSATWTVKIRKFYNSEAMKEIYRHEMNGIQQIIEGKYQHVIVDD